MTKSRNRAWPYRYVGSIKDTIEYYGEHAPEYMDFVSECCSKISVIPFDMSSIQYPPYGPSGYCEQCLDPCIFVVKCHNCGDNAVLTRRDFDQYCQECSDWIDSMD